MTLKLTHLESIQNERKNCVLINSNILIMIILKLKLITSVKLIGHPAVLNKVVDNSHTINVGEGSKTFLDKWTFFQNSVFVRYFKNYSFQKATMFYKYLCRVIIHNFVSIVRKMHITQDQLLTD